MNTVYDLSQVDKCGYTIINGESLEVLRNLPSNLVQVCITSPPYFWQRDYGDVNQIGMEKTPGKYIRNLMSIFDEVWRVLKDDGTLYVNIDDIYKHGKVPGKVPIKSYIGILPMFELAMLRKRWIFRNRIIWHKKNGLPESVKDRFVKRHEPFYMFVKQRYYMHNPQYQRAASIPSIRERTHHKYSDIKRPAKTSCQSIQGVGEQKSIWTTDNNGNPLSRMGDVISAAIGTDKHASTHMAPFPQSIINTLIDASSRPGDIILDCFCGSGTTGIVALERERRFIGIELVEQSYTLANQNCSDKVGLFNTNPRKGT